MRRASSGASRRPIRTNDQRTIPVQFTGLSATGDESVRIHQQRRTNAASARTIQRQLSSPNERPVRRGADRVGAA